MDTSDGSSLQDPQTALERSTPYSLQHLQERGGRLGPVVLGKKTSIHENPHHVEQIAEGRSFPPAQLPSGT